MEGGAFLDDIGRSVVVRHIREAVWEVDMRPPICLETNKIERT